MSNSSRLWIPFSRLPLPAPLREGAEITIAYMTEIVSTLFDGVLEVRLGDTLAACFVAVESPADAFRRRLFSLENPTVLARAGGDA